MRTIIDVESEINSEIKSITKDSQKSEVSAVKKKVAFLRMCKMYLETNPREEFVIAQRDDVKKKIDLIPDRYKQWTEGKSLSKYKDPFKSYCTEMGMSDLKSKLKTLNYLLA